MGKINAEWHRAHPMPKKPTPDQRIAWHLEHARVCGCRGIPDRLKEEMQRRGIDLPAPSARSGQAPA